MSPGLHTAGFDADSVVEALGGTWCSRLTGESAAVWLHFTNTARAIQFVVDPQLPAKRNPMTMRLWYSVESPTHLRFRPKPDHAGWLRGYRFDGAVMVLSAGDYSYVCTRPLPEEIPGWFDESLASALASP